MIEFIQGELMMKGTNYIVVQAGGIGYRLYVSALALASLPPVREEITVFAYLHVREDEFTLYGFLSMEDKENFNQLLSVSGVGPKVALAVQSRLKAGELRRAIILGELGVLVNIPGVGKKTAERMILELKDKMGRPDTDMQNIAVGGIAVQDNRGQAVAALLALGYSIAEAERAVPATPAGDKTATVEDLIRSALKTMTKY